MGESELYLWAMFQDCDGGVSNTPVGTCPVVDPMKNEYDTEKGQGCIYFNVIFKKLYPFQGVS